MSLRNLIKYAESLMTTCMNIGNFRLCNAIAYNLEIISKIQNGESSDLNDIELNHFERIMDYNLNGDKFNAVTC